MSTKNIILIAVAALAFWYLFIYKEKEAVTIMAKPDNSNGDTPSTPPSGPGSEIPQQSLVNVPNPTVRIAPIGG
jgi:hypothetical protein